MLKNIYNLKTGTCSYYMIEKAKHRAHSIEFCHVDFLCSFWGALLNSKSYLNKFYNNNVEFY